MSLADRQTRTFFTGVEVEHTIAYGTKTLFIVGTPSIDEINTEIRDLAEDNYAVEHLYFGTSQTYKNIDVKTAKAFERLIIHYLDNTDYWITLDFDVNDINRVHEAGYCERHKFIPMISVKMPYIKLLNYNATLKIDDREWGYSNPGVWTHHLQSLLGKNVYTDWSAYKGDK
jgi:hypothetical protein